MGSALQAIVVAFVAFVLAVFASDALGTIDERKLFILWALFALAIYGLLRATRHRSTKRDGG